MLNFDRCIMLPLVKMIIIAVVVVGVAAPTGYIAYKYIATPAPDPAHFIPEGTSSVLAYNVNGTSAIIFGGPQYSGIIANYNISNLENGRTPLNNNTLVNSTLSGKLQLHIELNTTYEGYNIYQLSNLSFNTVYKNFIIPISHSPYIGQISSSLLILGNLSSVKASINANTAGTYLKTLPPNFDLKYTGVSFYVNTSNLNVKPLGNVSNYTTYVPTNQGHLIYGNVSAMSTNITVTNLNSSQEHNLSLLVSVIPSNMTVSSGFKDGTYSGTFKIGYKNFDYAVTLLIQNIEEGKA